MRQKRRLFWIPRKPTKKSPKLQGEGKQLAKTQDSVMQPTTIQDEGLRSTKSQDIGDQLRKPQDDGKQSITLTNIHKRVYNSLTEPPRNVKECMDWLIALKGTDPEKNLKALGNAVYKFLADKPVEFTDVPVLEEVRRISKEFMEQPELKDRWYVKDILEMINGFVNEPPGDFAKTMGSNAVAVAQNIGHVVDGCKFFLQHVKTPGQYRFAYSSQATWDAKSAKEADACAAIFLGIALMLYVGIGSLQNAWLDAHFRRPPFIAYKRMQGVLKALGFVEPDFRANMSVSDVEKALGGVDKRVLIITYDLAGFWAFY
ncbi:hypothetical protein, conserved [Babesia ovata]|uniref:Uncharacterized protein n=1 Tax=Babesia ovata TaxID=189622 RepID=A0A2H6KBP9_9APIC|nr:uncharacterized protein BOVATA_019080 [Babesia ovata]GBE60415.1 hypothetical protein, conserved [Babesia ovata]